MEDLKKEWQEFVESQVWQGEDEFTKNIGVGNVADWWIEKFSSRQISLIKMIVERTREKIQEDLDAGGFYMICSNETTFKNYVMGVLSELTDGK
jgi:hypothetical protein